MNTKIGNDILMHWY